MKPIMENLLSKRFILVALLAGVLFFINDASIFAQRGQGDGQRGQGQDGQRQQRDPNQMFDRTYTYLVDSIQINEKQQKQVKTINETYKKKMETLRAEMRESEDRQAAREKFMKMREDYDAEIVGVLTEKQKAKYEEANERRKKQADQRRRGRGGDQQPQGRGNRGQQ